MDHSNTNAGAALGARPPNRCTWRAIPPAGTIAVSLALAVIPGPALAYIGPGAGLGAIAVMIALIVGVLLLVVGLVWYPLKRLLKSRSEAAGTGDQKATSDPE